MNLLIVFAFAGDSTMTRFLAIAERPKLVRRRRNSSRVRDARAYAGRRIDRAADDNTATSGRLKRLLAVEFGRHGRRRWLPKARPPFRLDGPLALTAHSSSSSSPPPAALY